MVKVIFICHGNICRSPVGDILFNKLIHEHHLEDKLSSISRATSMEEIGNDIYPPMKRTLYAHGVEFKRHYATRISKEEFLEADYILYMDHNNLYYLERLFGPSEKYILLRKYIDNRDIEDPWYTDRFELVFNQIKEGVESIFSKLSRGEKL